MNKLLTIGMATYDDYDGIYFTIQSLRMYHDICNTNQVEFVVIDNNPNSKQGNATKKFINSIGGNYIPYTEKVSSFAKYEIPKYSSGKYVLILDSHVLLTPNSVNNLLKYYKIHPNCIDLIQGPNIHDDLCNISTHWDPVWAGNMYGKWGFNGDLYSKGKPFEINMMGMGAFSFERDAWPKISPHFYGHGGEEGYISEKFRVNGGKNICLPSFKWLHRFGRPLGPKFELSLESRVLNYFIAWLDIYNNDNHEMIKQIYDYFKDKLPNIDLVLYKAKRLMGNSVDNGVSIVIPAYQAQMFIEECLDSIENQSYFKNNNNYEILLGIDACQETLNAVNKIKHKYRNLKIYMMNENRGSYITCNTLFGLVNNVHVIKFDIDDIMCENLVDEVMQYVDEYPLIRFNGLQFGGNVYNEKTSIYPGHGVFYVNKIIYDKLGGFKPWPCAADDDFLIRFSDIYDHIIIKDVLFYRRNHSNSLTRNIKTQLGSDLRKEIWKEHSTKFEYIVPVTNNFVEIT